jgi:isoquinoline 1-oxidoreductase beta subunit
MDTIRTTALSRRSLLVSSGAFGIAVTFGVFDDALTATAAAPFQANAWVTIDGDGTVTLMSPASEMGQGAMTALPSMIAEDLDADWSKVRVVQSPDDIKTYGNPQFFGLLITVGSRATPGYYEKLRIVGAQARKVLLANAAESWKVPVDELSTEPGVVVHAKSGRRISYGEIAKSATVPNPVPEATKADLKPLARCRYIGKDIPRVDVPLKVNGTAIYGIDTQLPNMLYASVLHAPVQGEKPETIDDAAAKAIKGVTQITPLPHGVAVIGETVEATMKAKAALKVAWSSASPARSYTTSANIAEEYRKLAADWSQKSVDMVKEGDAAGAIAGAAKVISADYFSDHVAHICMEPMSATVVVDGDRVEIWASNQSPTDMKHIGARFGGTTEDKVKVHTPLLGGGFGRRTDGDEVAEAVALAKTLPGRPIKVIWSREDDIQQDMWRPLAAQHVEVGLDANGNIVGWRHRVVAQSYIARAIPPLFEKMGGKDVVSASGGEFRYAVPSHQVDYIRAARGIEVGAWRGVASGYTKFAIETMIDEVAAQKGIDSLALRLDLLKQDQRSITVLKAVAEMAKWGEKRADGHALGLAYSDALNTYTAAVVEASVNQQTGEIRVHHIWAAVNPGIALQPKNVVAQMEGAMIFGLGAALIEQINLTNGEPKESNFHDYRVTRMSDVPPIEIKVISTEDPPTGIGEAGVPVVGPAIANAVAKLTGKRLRQLPMLPGRVLATLKGTA